MTATVILRLSLAGLAIATCAACSGGDDGDASAPPNERTTLLAVDPGDQASAVASGDFNGDGNADLALGAAFGDGPENLKPDAGEVLIFLGPIGSTGSLDAADRASTVFGAAAGDNFGRSLAAGDFDGDGLTDVAVGAPGTRESSGAVHVLFGDTQFGDGDLDLGTQGHGGAEYAGERAGDFAGLALSAAGIGGPGESLIVGALLAEDPNAGREDTGAVYVIDQPTPGPQASLAEAGVIVYGSDAGDHLGEALASGDVDGDGRGDLVLVAPFGDGPDESRMDCGETYVIAGSAVGEGVGGAAHVIYGTDPGDQLGHSIASGQVDGEPGADIWLGAVSADGPENTLDLAGEALLVRGGAGLADVIDTPSEDAGPLVFGPEEEARLGRAAAAGDTDGDGLAELLISAPNLNERRGQLYLVRGGDAEAGSVVFATGDDPGDELGTEIFGGPPIVVTDLDGDGAAEVIASASRADGPDGSRLDSGEAYVFWGAPAGADE
jgi:FG-GAP repeat